MKCHIHLFVSALVLAWAGPALAQEGTFFSVRNHRHYPEPEKRLEVLVRARGSQKLNHFCAIGYRLPGGSEVAWVLWEEGKAVILWEGSADPEYPVELALSRRYLDLDKDVVATAEEVGSSTYLVTREWVKGITRDCEAHGDKFVVTKPGKQRRNKTP
jgi:hypothetical protein